MSLARDHQGKPPIKEGDLILILDENPNLIIIGLFKEANQDRVVLTSPMRLKKSFLQPEVNQISEQEASKGFLPINFCYGVRVWDYVTSTPGFGVYRGMVRNYFKIMPPRDICENPGVGTWNTGGTHFPHSLGVPLHCH